MASETKKAVDQELAEWEVWQRSAHNERRQWHLEQRQWEEERRRQRPILPVLILTTVIVFGVLILLKIEQVRETIFVVSGPVVHAIKDPILEELRKGR